MAYATVTLYAQPYDITATGFYFKTYEEYEEKVAALKNEAGLPVEEFEIQFVDGDNVEARFAKAVGLNQVNVEKFLECVEDWGGDEMIRAILMLEDGFVGFDENSEPSDFEDIDVYEDMTMEDLAEHFVDEGLFGDIPEAIAGYLDYEKIARDLSMDYSETTVDGRQFIYRWC
ncbi:MAG: antirestriction protein ArdA [Geminicoccaceae bacterium]